MPNYRQSESIRQHFRRGQALAFGKGDVLLGNQLTPDGVYFVDTGYVKAYSISDDGSEYLHIIYGSGEIFPLVWAYVNFQPEVLFYEAISECTVWRISREWLTNMVSSDISFSKAMAVQMAQQFRVYIERVDNLEHKKAGERVAYYLLFLARRFGIKERGQVVIDVPITHETFANSINLARESVSREMEKLVDKGIVQRANSRIIISNMYALDKLADSIGQTANFAGLFAT